MRKSIASAALLAGLGLGVAFACSAQADSSTQAVEGKAAEGKGAQESSGPASMPSSEQAANPKAGEGPTSAQQEMPGAVEDGQARIAQLTGQLEDEFAKQFEQNQIEQAKLSQLISQLVQAFPEAARARVQNHIDGVFEAGKKTAAQMPADERSKAVAPTPKEKLGKTQQGLITGWGWGGGWGRGFGGFGAFGFPGMYSWGYPATYAYSYPSYGYYGTGYGCGLGGAWCGTGLGLGGWYW